MSWRLVERVTMAVGSALTVVFTSVYFAVEEGETEQARSEEMRIGTETWDIRVVF
jgi:hypothetical protein